MIQRKFCRAGYLLTFLFIKVSITFFQTILNSQILQLQRKRLISFMVFFLSGSLLFAQQPSVQSTTTLTTYYPSPFGEYDTIQLVPKAPGFVQPSSCQVGTMYVDSNGRFQYCRKVSGTETWGAVDQVWIQNGNNIYPADTMVNNVLNTNLKVGIGTTSPQNLLHIKGSNTAAVFENSADVQIVLKAAGQGVDSNNKFIRSELGNLHFGKYNDAGSTSVVQMAISNAGYVGIGTIGPNARLDVKGVGIGTTSFGLGIRNSNDQYSLIVRDDGNVGIGINPTAALEVGGLTKATGGLIIETRTTDPTGALPGRIWLRTDR